MTRCYYIWSCGRTLLLSSVELLKVAEATGAVFDHEQTGHRMIVLWIVMSGLLVRKFASRSSLWQLSVIWAMPTELNN